MAAHVVVDTMGAKESKGLATFEVHAYIQGRSFIELANSDNGVVVTKVADSGPLKGVARRGDIVSDLVQVNKKGNNASLVSQEALDQVKDKAAFVEELLKSQSANSKLVLRLSRPVGTHFPSNLARMIQSDASVVWKKGTFSVSNHDALAAFSPENEGYEWTVKKLVEFGFFPTSYESLLVWYHPLFQKDATHWISYIEPDCVYAHVEGSTETAPPQSVDEVRERLAEDERWRLPLKTVEDINKGIASASAALPKRTRKVVIFDGKTLSKPEEYVLVFIQQRKGFAEEHGGLQTINDCQCTGDVLLDLSLKIPDDELYECETSPGKVGIFTTAFCHLTMSMSKGPEDKWKCGVVMAVNATKLVRYFLKGDKRQDWDKSTILQACPSKGWCPPKIEHTGGSDSRVEDYNEDGFPLANLCALLVLEPGTRISVENEYNPAWMIPARPNEPLSRVKIENPFGKAPIARSMVYAPPRDRFQYGSKATVRYARLEKRDSMDSNY